MQVDVSGVPQGIGLLLKGFVHFSGKGTSVITCVDQEEDNLTGDNDRQKR